MVSKKSDYLNISGSEKLLPQEEMLEVAKEKKNVSIGVPKETSFQEKRVALAPSEVSVLVENGHNVLVETEAGKAAHFQDNEYSEAGAQIVYAAEEVYKCDIVVKVAPPSIEEIEMAKPRQTIFSALNLSGQDVAFFQKLAKKKITAISFEHIKDKTNAFPILRSISEIAGNTSILIAAEYLSHPELGRGKMLGGFSGIMPSEVVIVGAGTVGEFAARAALGLGATVKIFDNSIYKLKSIQEKLNQRVFTSFIHPDTLSDSLKTADVLIGAIHAKNGKSPCVVTDEMVKGMRDGSVIIDVSIDQGGCVTTSRITTHKKPVYPKYGVTHYCVPNIASRVPHTGTRALSNYFGNILLNIGDEGGVEQMLKHDPGVRNGVYLYYGYVTNKFISNTYNLPYKDIELLMATFHE